MSIDGWPLPYSPPPVAIYPSVAGATLASQDAEVVVVVVVIGAHLIEWRQYIGLLLSFCVREKAVLPKVPKLCVMKTRGHVLTLLALRLYR